MLIPAVFPSFCLMRKTWSAAAIAFSLWLLPGIVEAQGHPATVVRWQYGAPNSDIVIRNGRELLVLGQGGLSVVVNLAGLPGRRDRQVALVYVRNSTGQRFEVVPSKMSFDLVEPERNSFVYQDPDKLAKSVRSVSPWAYLFAGMAGMATQESHTTATVATTDGNMALINSTTTTPDNAARERAIQKLNDKRVAKEVAASKIEDSALRENTVLPGEDVWGDVFFNPPKRYANDYAKGKLEGVLRVPIGDCVFEFPYWWDRRMQPKNLDSDFPSLWKAKR